MNGVFTEEQEERVFALGLALRGHEVLPVAYVVDPEDCWVILWRGSREDAEEGLDDWLAVAEHLKRVFEKKGAR